MAGDFGLNEFSCLFASCFSSWLRLVYTMGFLLFNRERAALLGVVFLGIERWSGVDACGGGPDCFGAYIEMGE